MKSAKVFMHEKFAGIITEDSEGYHFQYDSGYLNCDNPEPISLTLPIKQEKYTHLNLFAFFDGLIPEGWLLEIAQKNWKLNPRDRMEILLKTCQDCIGAVSIQEIIEDGI